MAIRIILLISAFTSLFWGQSASCDNGDFPIQTFHTDSESQYTQLLIQKLETWPPLPVRVDSLAGREVQILVYETPNNRDYIGTELSMLVKAPMSAIESVINDVAHYKDFIPGFEEIRVAYRDRNRFDVFWERIIPVFFIKNLKYTTTYWVDKSKPDRRVYHSQLTSVKGLKALDGLLILESKGQNTAYYETAFFDGDFGFITSIAPMKIWRESVEAVLHAALAKKMKAEIPEKSYDAIMNDVLTEVKTYPVEALVDAKKPYPFLPKTKG